MSWASTTPKTQTLTDHLAVQPQLQAKYQQFMATLWDAERVPTRLLELARLRIAAIHDCEEQWLQRHPDVRLKAHELAALQQGRREGFDELAQLVLEVAELMPLNHHEISDAQVAALRHALDEGGTVAVLTALAFFDVNARLSKTLGATANPAEEAANV
ncbi:MAG: carboxymuconolactone decarboxylase family protein [Pseudomonadales bacterium]